MVEGLGTFLKDVVADKKIGGLRLHGDDLPVSHQQFFDDIMLMVQPIIREARDINLVLTHFMDASYTSINHSKSQLFFFITAPAIHIQIYRIVGFQRSSLPYKYLDAPLIENGLCNSPWEYILFRMDQKMTNWSFHSLNTPGCLVLLNLVLQVMPLYRFLALMAPKFILKFVFNLQRIFMWGGARKEIKWALVSSDKLCLPKIKVGLGLHDPKILISVLGANTYWRWLNNSDNL
jgi:hypothetical protein